MLKRKTNRSGAELVVQIRLSRHAKRRAKLYHISESAILKILEGKRLAHGNHAIIETIEGLKFPLKLVVAVRDDIVTVVTNYPLKKGKR